ncbi:hypothetical protein [Metabacillus lacus]|nr:hypothetical protein [Metabacillus lacus]
MSDIRAEQLAEELIRLDLKRDELWEELLKAAGSKAYLLLRCAQNKA